MTIITNMSFFILIFLIFGCSKPNPNPELTDEVYLDLVSQTNNAKKDLESEKKKFDEYKKELETTSPQGGTLKFTQKRFFESESRIQRLAQQAKYLELKSDTRRRYSKSEYIKAYNSGKFWPNTDEFTDYKKNKLLATKKSAWDSRKRVESYEQENGLQNVSKAAVKVEKGEKKAESKSAE